jgi:hypothetical protein
VATLGNDGTSTDDLSEEPPDAIARILADPKRTQVDEHVTCRRPPRP